MIFLDQYETTVTYMYCAVTLLTHATKLYSVVMSDTRLKELIKRGQAQQSTALTGCKQNN